MTPSLEGNHPLVALTYVLVELKEESHLADRTWRETMVGIGWNEPQAGCTWCITPQVPDLLAYTCYTKIMGFLTYNALWGNWDDRYPGPSSQ